MNHRRYLITLLAATALLSAAMVLFAAVVDPLDIYRLVRADGFNASKTEYQSYARIAKPVQIEQHRYERLAFGSSRVDLALPVEYGQWARDYPHGFNAGLNSANLQSILEVLQHATVTGTVKDVLIGTDFYMFNGMNQTDYLYPAMLAPLNPNPWQRRFQQLSTTLFSPGIVDASLATLRHQDGPPKRKPTGQASMAGEIDKARREGYAAQFERYEDGLVRHVWTPCRDNRFAYHYAGGRDSLALFRQILALSRQEGFRLTLFIAPVHARLLEVMDAAGLWGAYEQWKRDLTTLVAAHNAAGDGTAPVTLWDFSGYHAYAAEPIPADPAATMQWYIDSSHYTEALAERMIDAMYGNARGFGVPLAPVMLEAHLAALRAGREAYRAGHPGQYEALARRTGQLLAEKRRNGRHCPPAARR